MSYEVTLPNNHLQYIFNERFYFFLPYKCTNTILGSQIFLTNWIKYFMSGPGGVRTHISLAYEASAFTNLATGPNGVQLKRTYTPFYFQVMLLRENMLCKAKPVLCRYKLLKTSLLHPNFYSRN